MKVGHLLLAISITAIPQYTVRLLGVEFTSETISSVYSRAIVVIGASIRTARFSHDFQ